MRKRHAKPDRSTYQSRSSDCDQRNRPAGQAATGSLPLTSGNRLHRGKKRRLILFAEFLPAAHDISNVRTAERAVALFTIRIALSSRRTANVPPAEHVAGFMVR